MAARTFDILRNIGRELGMVVLPLGCIYIEVGFAIMARPEEVGHAMITQSDIYDSA